MEIYLYLLLILIGTGMIVVANQQKRIGKFTSRSKMMQNIGIVIIVYSLAVKLPDFIRLVMGLIPHG